MITLEEVGFSKSMEGLKCHKKEFSGVEDVKNQNGLPRNCLFFEGF